MKNYLVLCNFARYGVELNNKLFTSQWTVGSFAHLINKNITIRVD